MKYKVKRYENYIEFYPGTQDIKQVFEEGSIIEVADIENDIQKYKLEKCTEDDFKKLVEEEKKDVILDVFDDTPIVPITTLSSDEKKRAAQEKLRAGQNT